MCYKCVACGKEFETSKQLRGHNGRCEKRKEIILTALPKEVLYQLMFVENKSANYIAKVWLPQNYNISTGAGSIIVLAKSYGFQTRTVAEANANEERQKLFVETNRKKYGVDNVSQLKEIKQKKEDTFMKHYGLKNIFCDKEFVKERFFQKYGVYNNMQRTDFNLEKCNGFKSKLQQEVEKILDKYNIQYISDKIGKFLKFNEELQKDYNPRPDILIEDKKIIIEVQGDKWHANPKFYKPNDIIEEKWGDEKEAHIIWKKDEIRKKHLESFGYIVYFIWENDIIHNRIKVENDIKNWLDIKDETC